MSRGLSRFILWLLIAVAARASAAETAAAAVNASVFEAPEVVAAQLVERASGYAGSAPVACFDQPPGPSSAALERTRKFCSLLSEYGSSKKPLAGMGAGSAAASGELPNLCSAVWAGGKPPVLTPEQKSVMQKYGTRDRETRSRSAMLADGYAVLTPEQRTANLKVYGRIRDEMASTCCGSDDACSKAVSRVRLLYCSSAADKNPSLKDSCTGEPGSFSLSDAEAKGLDDANTYGRAAAVVSGRIVLNPYIDQSGRLVAAPETFRHEMGHVCSIVRKQLAGAGDSHAAFNTRELMLGQLYGSCSMPDVMVKPVYDELGRAVSLESGVTDCLRRLAAQADNPKSSLFVKDSCYPARVEEGFAETMAVLGSNPVAPRIFPQRACKSPSSRYHPASWDTFACVARHSAVVRKRLSDAFVCEAAR